MKISFSALFALVFNGKTFQYFESTDKVPGRNGPVVDKVQVKGYFRELDQYRCMRPDEMQARVLREPAGVVRRPSPWKGHRDQGKSPKLNKGTCCSYFQKRAKRHTGES